MTCRGSQLCCWQKTCSFQGQVQKASHHGCLVQHVKPMVQLFTQERPWETSSSSGNQLVLSCSNMLLLYRLRGTSIMTSSKSIMQLLSRALEHPEGLEAVDSLTC